MSKSNLEILAYEPSPLGPLCLRRRELLSQPGTIVTEMTLNHEFLMSSPYTDSERGLASTTLQMHSGTDLRVLVGGLGLIRLVKHCCPVVSPALRYWSCCLR